MGNTKLPVFNNDGQSAFIDMRSESLSGYGRQVISVGDPVSGNAVVSVQATDPSSNTEGLVVRDVNTSAIVSRLNSTLFVSLDPGHDLGVVDAHLHALDSTNAWEQLGGGSGTVARALRVVHATDIGASIQIIGVNTLNTLSIFLPDTGHTLGKIDQGVASTTQAWLINSQGTASIFTASGSASGVSVSGNTIISPSANYSFKIYAFSIQTTGQVSLTTKFTNGAGTSPTEFWRPLVTAAGVTGAQGANLTSTPPNPLFVTGTSTTLSLVLDSATLVHYSVAYTKESA